MRATTKLRGGIFTPPRHIVSTLHVENFPSDQGGNLTMADFASNKAFLADALTVDLNNGKYKVHAAPPPSSGVVVQFILKVMDGKTWPRLTDKHCLVNLFKPHSSKDDSQRHYR